jgi:hypothetical protein
MIEGVVPCTAVKEGERSESIEYAADAAMLCMKPRVWPISCAMTYLSDLDISVSGSFIARTRGST